MTGTGRDAFDAFDAFDASSTLAASVLRPRWPVAARVRALSTTRAGGVSQGPFASLNLCSRCGDDLPRVQANRARLMAILPAAPAWLRQVHGCEVVDAATARGEPRADASFTTAPGVVCCVLTADRLPVLLADVGGGVVGIAHAGWRGLAAGVIERTVDAMRRRVPGAVLQAWIGPGISRTAFEVGDDVRDAFCGPFPQDRSAFQPASVGAGCGAGGPAKWLADLELLARWRLERCGVTVAELERRCTAREPRHFFSYRRDRVTGRMASCIWIADDPVAGPVV
ncbi:MAG: peptidoglycan editing factor PgeF [Burkholderiales bacterium]|nr:MAG: peptidoglycan editing factor PgeF [Burkholderiales bacterium]